jgi:hypothetical protein
MPADSTGALALLRQFWDNDLQRVMVFKTLDRDGRSRRLGFDRCQLP